jgi:hypothetical protein
LGRFPSALACLGVGISLQDGADDEQLREAFVGVARHDPTCRDGRPHGAQEPADDAHPVAAEDTGNSSVTLAGAPPFSSPY